MSEAVRTTPILSTGPMVRAILDGRKTQTRRIVTPGSRQSRWLTTEMIDRVPHGHMTREGWQMHHPLSGTTQSYGVVAHDSPFGFIRSPYGTAGDTLWVRETWALSKRAPKGTTDREWVWFRADNDGDSDIVDGKWRPSIFMPRWASRITLDITDVRVERLNDITEEDAKAEGAQRFDDIPDHSPYGRGGRWLMMKTPTSTDECFGSARMAFANAWDSINKKRAPWSSNPWVWVVTLKRSEP